MILVVVQKCILNNHWVRKNIHAPRILPLPNCINSDLSEEKAKEKELQKAKKDFMDELLAFFARCTRVFNANQSVTRCGVSARLSQDNAS